MAASKVVRTTRRKVQADGPAAPLPAPTVAKLTCGIVMPIAGIDGCSSEHWSEVKEIIVDAVESIASPIFEAKLVSDADEVGVIQKRIVQNLYEAKIVVCDVSAKNPNVMFELGMRLAFDKATVIIKDDKTDYSFDTGVIEHLGYPRDLRFGKVVEFKRALGEKVLATYNASINDQGHSTFLKNFGKFHVAKLEETAVSSEQAVLEQLTELTGQVARMRARISDVSRSRAEDASRGVRTDDRTVEGIARLGAVLQRFCVRTPGLDVRSLIGDDGFARHMEQESGVHRFFESQSQFRLALDTLLRAQEADFRRSRPR